MAKRDRKIYLETVNGDSWTGHWFRNNLAEGPIPTRVQRGPDLKHLWPVTRSEFRMVEKNHFVENLKYRVYTNLEGNRPHRDYELEKSPKQRTADAVGEQLNKFKDIKTRAIRGHLALIER